MKGRDKFQKLDVGRSILHEEIDLEGVGQEGWTTLIWLKIGARKGTVMDTTCVNILLVIFVAVLCIFDNIQISFANKYTLY